MDPLATGNRPAPDNAPENPYRGVPLADRSALLEERVTRLGAHVDAEAIRTRWSEWVDTEPWPPRFRAAAGLVDDATWRRARAWALTLAVAFLASSADAATMRRIGEHTLREVLADPTASS